jgi:hypothetical protein
VNYKPFLDLIKLRRSRAISEGHFILDWRLAQRDQGIIPAGRDRTQILAEHNSTIADLRGLDFNAEERI